MATPPIPPRHDPVMLDEIVAVLAPVLVDREGARPPVLVDCTLGLGGHAEALLRACPDAHLIGLDRDPAALALAAERLAPYADRTTFVEAVYDELAEVLDRLGHPRVQGVLLDLGLSSLQIDDTSSRLRVRGRRPAGHADGRPAGAHRGRGAQHLQRP